MRRQALPAPARPVGFSHHQPLFASASPRVYDREQLSDIPTVRELVALMQAHGVTRCVLCPGSRNAPIVRSLSSTAAFSCRAVTDERSAGYLALGWSAAAHGAPVAVCVTSGSALLNLHPAVAEAHYRHIPLLILSADRPGAWIDQQDGQTLPQPGVYGTLTIRNLSLPESGDAWHRNRLINEALLALQRRGGGPVHLNIPLAPPLNGVCDEAILPPRVIRLSRLDSEADCALLRVAVAAAPRRMLLLGQLPECPLWAEAFRRAGWAVVGEHLSNAGAIAQTSPESLLTAQLADEKASALSPDLLISCGGCLISPRLKQLLRRRPPREHWHVSPNGEVIDSFCCLSRCLVGRPEQMAFLADTDTADRSYAEHWMRPSRPTGSAALGNLEPSAPTDGASSPSGPALVGAVMAKLRPGDTLHLANSSAVRFAQLFNLPNGVQVECNRGTNGIEGSLSTALGYAMSPEARGLQLLVIGDLSFFYDMNALGLPELPPSLRILLLNNGGGGIFATLPGPSNTAVSGICRSGAEGWAVSCGCRYQALRRAEESDVETAWLMDRENDGPVLLEAFTDAVQDAAELASILG